MQQVSARTYALQPAYAQPTCQTTKQAQDPQLRRRGCVIAPPSVGIAKITHAESSTACCMPSRHGDIGTAPTAVGLYAVSSLPSRTARTSRDVFFDQAIGGLVLEREAGLFGASRTGMKLHSTHFERMAMLAMRCLSVCQGRRSTTRPSYTYCFKLSLSGISHGSFFKVSYVISSSDTRSNTRNILVRGPKSSFR